MCSARSPNGSWRRDNAKNAVARYLILADHLRNRDTEAATAAVERALAINPQHPKALEYQRKFIEQFDTN